MADSLGAAPATTTPPLERRQWVTLVVLTLSTFLVLLDASVVNVALPVIAADLSGSLEQATWVVAGYILAFAALLIFCGRLADIFGRRRLFVSGVAVFTLASLGCALAPSIELLIAARVAQGIGAAMLEPSTLALIKTTFPRERLGFALGIQGIAAGVSTAIGPTLGGLIATSVSWRSIFLLNVPVGIAAILAALVFISESRDPSAARRLDLPGVVLSGAGVFCIIFALIEGERLGWSSVPILGAFAAGALALAAFVIVERRTRESLVDLSLFADRLFAVGNVLRAIVLFVLLGTVFALPLYWQTQLGYSPLDAGLQLLPLSIAAFFASPLAGGLADRFDVRWLVGFGFATVAAGALWLSRLSAESGALFFVVPLALVGVGLAFLFAPTTTATLRHVPDAKSGIASGIAYTAGEIGAALGVAAVAAVLQRRFATSIEAAIADAGLPPQVAGGILTGPADGVQAGGPAGAPQVAELVRSAFADAVGFGLLVVVVVSLLGAVLALLFFSSRQQASYAPETGSERSDARLSEASGMDLAQEAVADPARPEPAAGFGRGSGSLPAEQGSRPDWARPLGGRAGRPR